MCGYDLEDIMFEDMKEKDADLLRDEEIDTEEDTPKNTNKHG